jgi:hypothetical protein
MGGAGSTRWNDCDRKLTVEECFSLDINILVKDGVIRFGYRDSDIIVWKNQVTGIKLGTCEIQADRGGQGCSDRFLSFISGKPFPFLSRFFLR